jgi:hypothetical protein
MSPEEWLASQPKSAPAVTEVMSPEEFIAGQQKPEMGFFEGMVEQVTGRQKRLQFQMHVNTPDLEKLLTQLRDDFTGAGIQYWVTPILSQGVF